MPGCLPNVVFAGYRYRAWYEPQEESPLLSVINNSSGNIYFCRYCFKYTGDEGAIASHETSWCRLRQEPTMLGTLRCTKGDYSIYEIDPLKSSHHKLFAQCLCLNAKLFLSNKYIFFDLSGFLLYVVYGPTPGLVDNQTSTRHDAKQQIMGFFSKERISWDNNNLSCILVLPPFHSRGLGQLLISFSYALSQSQGLIGSPEKPLSKLGSQAYQTFWKQTVARTLNNLFILSNKLWNDNSASHDFKVSLKDLSNLAGMRPEDVFWALAAMDSFQPLHHHNETISTTSYGPIQFDPNFLCIDLYKILTPPHHRSDMLVQTDDLIL